MAKIFSTCRICVIIPRTASTKKWTKDQIEKWVKMAGGVLHKEFDPQTTTHLVVEEQLWKNRTMAVQLALEANDNGRKVYIVTPQWFDDCLVTQKKLKEKEFLWENIDQKAAGDQRKKRGKQTGEGEGEEAGEDGVSGPKSHQAMLGEVLQEGTEDYVGDHDRRVFEAENAERQKAEKELQEIEARRKEKEKQAAEEKRKAHAELMKKSAKKGRGEEFNGMLISLYHFCATLTFHISGLARLQRHYWLRVRLHAHQSRHPHKQERTNRSYCKLRSSKVIFPFTFANWPHEALRVQRRRSENREPADIRHEHALRWDGQTAKKQHPRDAQVELYYRRTHVVQSVQGEDRRRLGRSYQGPQRARSRPCS